MNRNAALLLLLLSGCDGCDRQDELPDVLTEISGAESGLWVGTGSGVGSVTIPVLTVNEVGASVAGGTVTLASSATLLSTSVTPDVAGWSYAEFSAETPGAYEVAATSGFGSETTQGFVSSAEPPVLGFRAWDAAGVTGKVAFAGGGVVASRGGELWWSSELGGAPVRVLALPDAITGLRAIALDDDGVGDILAWSDGSVVALRGRSAGGLGFFAGFSPNEGTVRGALVQKLDNDAVADLLVVASTAEGSDISWLRGNGQGAFELEDVLQVEYECHAVSAEEFDGDGDAEVTVLTGDGLLRRYARGEGLAWQLASRSDFTLGIATGATLDSTRDLTGDGIVDIVVVGPLSDGTGAAAYVVSAGSTSPITYAITGGGSSPPAALASSVYDADANGLADLFLMAPGLLYRARWSSVANTFSVSAFNGTPEVSSMAVGELTGDALGDVLVGGTATVLLPGTSVADDESTPDADESVEWQLAAPFDNLFNPGLLAGAWAGDFTGDGLVDLVGFTDNAGLAVQGFYSVPASGETRETMKAAKAYTMDDVTGTLDLAVCGEDVWALVETSGGTLVRHLTLDSFGALTWVEDVVASGDQVVCGTFEAAEAVVVDELGDLTWISGGAAVEASGEGPYGDVVAADLDGDGVDALEGCVGVCSVAAGDVDGDGVDDLAWSDETASMATIAGVEQPAGMLGDVSVFDADGDGVGDLLVHQGGVVAVYRGEGGVLGPSSLSYMPRPVGGRAIFGDVDGNALPDLLLQAEDDDLEDSVDWNGTVLYGQATEPAAE